MSVVGPSLVQLKTNGIIHESLAACGLGFADRGLQSCTRKRLGAPLEGRLNQRGGSIFVLVLDEA